MIQYCIYIHVHILTEEQTNVELHRLKDKNRLRRPELQPWEYHILKFKDKNNLIDCYIYIFFPGLVRLYEWHSSLQDFFSRIFLQGWTHLCPVVASCGCDEGVNKKQLLVPLLPYSQTMMRSDWNGHPWAVAMVGLEEHMLEKVIGKPRFEDLTVYPATITEAIHGPWYLSDCQFWFESFSANVARGEIAYPPALQQDSTVVWLLSLVAKEDGCLSPFLVTTFGGFGFNGNPDSSKFKIWHGWSQISDSVS